MITKKSGEESRRIFILEGLQVCGRCRMMMVPYEIVVGKLSRQSNRRENNVQETCELGEDGAKLGGASGYHPRV